MENSVDPSHLYWLHGYRYGSGHLIDPVQKAKREAQYAEKHEFIPFEYGIMKRRITPNGTDEHPLLFPCALRHVSGERGKANPLYRHNIQVRVPMDDTHTRVYRVNFVPMPGVTSPADADAPWELRPLKYVDQFEGDRQLPMDIPMTKYDTSIVGAQDSMAWETQGPITDRTREHLGHADKGIVMFRRMLREQIEVVQKGGEPLGVIRDPAKNKLIDIPVVNERIGLVRQAAE
jgi:5,5'-dehydrodivanillate O-demethylase